MTGIMVEPVAKTAKKSIWPVLIEIVVLNMVLTLAMLALPETMIGTGGPGVATGTVTTVKARDTMVRMLAAHYVGRAFAAGRGGGVRPAAVVGGQHGDHRAGEHPVHDGARTRSCRAGSTGLNRWGMPAAAAVDRHDRPGGRSCMFIPDVGQLADLVRDRRRGRRGAQPGGVLDEPAARDGAATSASA